MAELHLRGSAGSERSQYEMDTKSTVHDHWCKPGCDHRCTPCHVISEISDSQLLDCVCVNMIYYLTPVSHVITIPAFLCFWRPITLSWCRRKHFGYQYMLPDIDWYRLSRVEDSKQDTSNNLVCSVIHWVRWTVAVLVIVEVLCWARVTDTHGAMTIMKRCLQVCVT